MKKALFTLALIVGLSTMSFAQNSNVKYHGEFDLGYSFGVGTFKADRVNAHTIQGIQIGECFSTGLGIGVDYYTKSTEAFIPVFLNVKGYYPTGSNIKPYLSLDLGYGFGVTKGVNESSGFYFSPSLGVKLKWFKIQAGYTSQRISSSGIGANLNAIQIKLGFMF